MENAINMYTNMINIVLISSIVIVLLTIITMIVIGIKRKKNMKKICTSCGNRIDNDSSFCKHCGIKQNTIL